MKLKLSEDVNLANWWRCKAKWVYHFPFVKDELAWLPLIKQSILLMAISQNCKTGLAFPSKWLGGSTFLSDGCFFTTRSHTRSLGISDQCWLEMLQF